MNEYQIAIFASGFIAAFLVVLYVLCWVGQWAWAWVDDSEIDNENILSKHMTLRRFSKWKYPVWNGRKTDSKKPFGYAKDESLNDSSVHNLREGVDYLYDWRFPVTLGGFISSTVIVSLMPIISLLAFKFYYVLIPILSLFLLAHLARFARRHKKIFDDHVKDKGAHK